MNMAEMQLASCLKPENDDGNNRNQTKGQRERGF